MMTKKRFIPILLFYILLFTKTFCQQIKVAINRNHLKELNVPGWNERFDLRLFVVNLNSGKVVVPLVAKGNTGRYDLATLEIEPYRKATVKQVQEIGKGKELGGSSINAKEKGRFELQIDMISPAGNVIQQQQTIKKRVENLPNENEILYCLFDSNEEDAKPCEFITDETKIMELERPKRNILFKMNLKNIQKFHLKRIECTERNDVFLQPELLKQRANFVEYDGPVCPMDIYTFHFIAENGESTSEFYFNCDEAIYFSKTNHYELSEDKCELQLIEDNSKDVKNTQGPQSSSAHSEQQMKKLKWKEISTFNLSMKKPTLFPSKSWTNLMHFSRMSHQQSIHQYHPNSSTIHDMNTNPAIEKIIKQLAKDKPAYVAQFPPERLKQIVKQFLQQKIQSQNSNVSGIPSQSHHLSRSATVPRVHHPTHQHSTIISFGPSYGSIPANSQNSPSTNSQQKQIPLTLDLDQELWKYLQQHFNPQHDNLAHHLQQHLAIQSSQNPVKPKRKQRDDGPVEILDSSMDLMNFDQVNAPQKNYDLNQQAYPNISTAKSAKQLNFSNDVPQQIYQQQRIGHFQSQKQFHPTVGGSVGQQYPPVESSAFRNKEKDPMPVGKQSHQPESESISMDVDPAGVDLNFGLGLPSTGSSSPP